MEEQTAHTPMISVILPVYNAEKYVKESILSVLNQTYGDFEIIVLNDGSTDNSSTVIQSLSDPRIIYTEHKNMGLAATLNVGLRMARGKFIARQDNDDICLPERFQKQVDFLNSHHDVALVGTRAEIVDEEGRPTGRFHLHPIDNISLKFSLAFDNPFVHSSVMFRRDIIDNVGDYSTDKNVFEDYNLWSRVARQYNVANLGECLLKYRELNSGMSKSTRNYHTLVINQSVQNILFYSNSMSSEDAMLLSDHQFLLGKVPNSAKAIVLYSELLSKFIKDFCLKENAQPSELSREKEKKILAFKRSAYNTIIYSPKQTAFAKLKAIFNRKIMFILNKKKLG